MGSSFQSLQLIYDLILHGLSHIFKMKRFAESAFAVCAGPAANGRGAGRLDGKLGDRPRLESRPSSGRGDAQVRTFLHDFDFLRTNK